MNTRFIPFVALSAFLLLGAYTTPVMADRGKHGANVQINVNLGFGERERVIVHDYYGREYQQGHCPPGLAKKRNGCMPPGLAKQWRKGHPLPRGVIYHELPPALVVEIGAPPKGYKYVRVAADILMIAVGTAIVVDAIEDLSRL